MKLSVSKKLVILGGLAMIAVAVLVVASWGKIVPGLAPKLIGNSGGWRRAVATATPPTAAANDGDHGYLEISVQEQCVPFVVTDTQGRRTGYDTATGRTLEEIRGATYDAYQLDDVANPGSPAVTSCAFELPHPSDGAYTIRLTAEQTTGSYTLNVEARDRVDVASSVTESVEIAAGAVRKYVVYYSSAPGQPVTMRRIDTESR